MITAMARLLVVVSRKGDVLFLKLSDAFVFKALVRSITTLDETAMARSTFDARSLAGVRLRTCFEEYCTCVVCFLCVCVLT